MNARTARLHQRGDSSGLRLVEGADRPRRLPGEAAVSRGELRAKLGRNAARVHEVLSALAPAGEAHCTYRALMRPHFGCGPLSYDQVHRALRRLRDAGLVRWQGRQKRRVQVGALLEELRVPVRRVAVLRSASRIDSDQVLVPTRTAAWLIQAKGWGGARQGAGARWMLDQTAHKNRRWRGGARTPQSMAQGAAKRDSDDHSNRTVTGSATTIQTALPIRDPLFVKGSVTFSPNGEKDRAAPVDAAPFDSILPLRGREQEAVALGVTYATESRTHVRVLPNGIVLWPDDPDITLWRREDGRIWVPGLNADIPGLPPCPKPERLPVRCYPKPPPLDPAATDAARALAVARSYHRVLHKRYRVRWPTAEALAKGKQGERIAEVARAMLEHGVAPATWCWWRCDQWDEQRKGKPSLAYVLDPNAVEKHHGWFHAEEPKFAERPIPNPHRAELVRRYGQLYVRLVMQGAWPQPLAERKAAARELFPPGTEQSYDALLARAEQHYEREQARLTAMARDGRWIW